jgi:outer membrane lipoprotein carrier protein
LNLERCIVKHALPTQLAAIAKPIATFLLAACAITSWANGLDSLESFLKSTRSGSAEFTQTVTSPARDGQAPKVKVSSGTFEFARPNRFKFNYKKPFEQTIVADGQTLWLYDVDLNQVTANKQANVLASTPAAIIASAPDLKSLEQHFSLKAAPDQDGLSWVSATPKAKEGAVQSIRVGFKTEGGELAALDILDNFGQRSLLKFQKVQANTAVAPNAFNFTPPAGADVIKQ